MADVDEEISEMVLKSILREIGRAGLKGAAALLQALYDGAQGFLDRPAEIEPRVDVEMTRGDFEAAAKAALQEGIDLRAEKWDPAGGPDSMIVASIPVSQIDKFREFWEKAIAEQLVSRRAEPAYAPEGPGGDPEAEIAKVATAVKDAGGEFEHSVDEKTGSVTMRATAAPGANLAETVSKAAALMGVELSGVVQLEIPEADFSKLKLYADSMGVFVAVDGTDRFGEAVEDRAGMMTVKVREADGESFKMALAKAVVCEEGIDPGFARRCEELSEETDRELARSRDLAAPCVKAEIPAPEFEAFRESPSSEGVPYVVAGGDAENVVVAVPARDAASFKAAMEATAPLSDKTAARLEAMEKEAKFKQSSLARSMRSATQHSLDSESRDAHDRNRSQSRDR